MIQRSKVMKPKTAKGKRAIEQREPKLHENNKRLLLLRGNKTSPTVLAVIKDIQALKSSSSMMMKERNDVHPFDDPSLIEKMSSKFDHSLFVLANSNKKRPDNLVFGRLFDGHICDMVEFGVTSFKSMASYKGEKILPDSKPCLVFQGPAFEASDDMRRIKNLLIDIFRGPEIVNLNAAGVEHCLQFTAVSEHVIQVRSYRILLSKSGTPRIPSVSLEEIGPSINLAVRRTQLASAELFASACKKRPVVAKLPDDLPKRKIKSANTEVDELGSKMGRIYRQAQDLTKLETRKMKGLRA